MSKNLLQHGQWKLQAHGQQNLFVRGRNERSVHVLMKAFLWALYLPDYPDMLIEIRIGDRYKPDVVSLDTTGKPLFWGESGQVSRKKIENIVKRHRNTHFAITKWDKRLSPYIEIISNALQGVKRQAPFDLIRFEPNSAERFIDNEGNLTLTFDDLEWKRFTP